MKSGTLKLLICFIVSMTLTTFFSGISVAEDFQKIILITVDNLDLTDFSDIESEKSVGMISMVAGSGSKSNESQMLSMAVGRRVEVEPQPRLKVIEDGGGLKVSNYSYILAELDKEYRDFSKNIPFLGATLDENGIRTAYIGEGKDILLMADIEGYIDYGIDEMVYDHDWISESLEDILAKADIVHLSYDTEGNSKRKELLRELVASRDELVIIISKSVPASMGGYLNKTLAPIFLINDGEGILLSDSTRRPGIVSNLDIKPTILNYYSLEDRLAIGNPVATGKSQYPEEELKSTLQGFVNLGVSKYIFHGIIIIVQLTSMYMILFRPKHLLRHGWILMIPSIILMIAIGSSLSRTYRYWYIYVPLILGFSFFISNYLFRQRFRSIAEIATVTNLSIVAIVMIKFDLIYNSFIGYNNIVAGGRFYGFNNDIMGVFIATSIISYYYISDKLRISNKIFFTVLYIPLMVVINSSAYGNNFGGLMTSVFLAFAIIYFEFLNRKIDRKKSGTILIIIVAIIITLMCLLGKQGHIGEFFIRVREYGFIELINMIEVKVRQLIFMMALPPWSIMVVTQVLFAITYIKRNRHSPHLYRNIIMFATAIFALLINDTGVVSFVYIMSYFVSMLGLRMLQKDGFTC